MAQQQREAITDMSRASPFNPADDLHEQRPLFGMMVAAVVNTKPPGRRPNPGITNMELTGRPAR